MKFIAAAAAAFLMTTSAQAAVVTVKTQIVAPKNNEGVYINFVTGELGYADANPPWGWDLNIFSSAIDSSIAYYLNGSNGGVATGAGFADLAPGEVVSSSSHFRMIGDAPAFLAGGDHVLGIRFLHEGPNIYNYGYLNITTGGGTGYPAMITGWSYEDTGAAITVASAVPEPATWAMMIIGFGAAGSMVRVSRRRNAFNAAY